MELGRIFVNGKWQSSRSEACIPMIDPATAEIYGHVARGEEADVDDAVMAARAAFDHGHWGRVTAAERGRVLRRFADVILANATELSAIEARDTGKPSGAADADIVALARYFEFYGGGADKIHGETIPYMAGHQVSVIREPHGVTGHILPWNYPAQMFGRTLAPSLAAGNATVLKPAEDASASALRLAELAVAAGLPPGAINVVTGFGATAGAALASHPGVNFVSFTGSPAVGQIVQELCAKHYSNCVLELGGKSPQIVFGDADFDAAIPVIVKAIVQNSGQTCSAGSRLLIQRSAYEDFLPRLAAAFGKVRVGAPQMNLDCGPIISTKQLSRVESFLDGARRDGIPILAEGSIAEGVSAKGFYVKPTLLGPVPRSNPLAMEEVFGPVLSVLPFDDEADAIALANATEYGLVAGLWTRDGGRQVRVAKKIRAGQLFINCYGAGAGIELPFGGTGKSGHGREKGFAALHEFTTTKTIVLNHG